MAVQRLKRVQKSCLSLQSQRVYVKNKSKRKNCLYHKCKKTSSILLSDSCVVMEHKATTSLNCPTTCGGSSRGEHKCYYQRQMSNTHLQLGEHMHELSHIGSPLVSPVSLPGAVAFSAFGEDTFFT